MTTARQEAAPFMQYLEVRDEAVEAVHDETGLNLREQPRLASGERQIVARIVSQGLLAKLKAQDVKGAATLEERLEKTLEHEPRTDLLDIALDYGRKVTRDSKTIIERRRLAELAQAVEGTAETVTATMLGSGEVVAVAFMARQMIGDYRNPSVREGQTIRETLKVYVDGAVTAAAEPTRTAV